RHRSRDQAVVHLLRESYHGEAVTPVVRGWLALAVRLAALVRGVHLALTPLIETDLFFHLKIGERILDRHAIPFQNLFSFTYPAHPDPDLSWAFQVVV